MIGEDKFIKFTGCKSNKSCTIVLRGSSKHILDEAERSFHDAICVLVNTIKNKMILYTKQMVEYGYQSIKLY